MTYRQDYEMTANDLLMYEARVTEVEERLKSITALRDKCAEDLRVQLAAHKLKSVTVDGKRITFRTEKRWRGPAELMREHCLKSSMETLLTTKEREYTAWVNKLDEAGVPIPPQVKNFNLVTHSITRV